MLVIRTARMADLDPLYELISSSTYGLTTLKITRDQLEERLEDSQFSFRRKPKKPVGQPYVFVMEDLDRGHVVGTCSIYSKVGGFEPLYAYRLERVVRESHQLRTSREFEVLHLVKEHDGPTEIGSLFLHPDYRGGGHGRLLSLSRFLFIGSFPDRFDTQVIAEMRGRVNADGQSPFWEAIGRHFFDIDFPKAEMATTVSKGFIADLMPKLPIYINLLSKEAQEVIGQVHENTKPALRLLEKEGFTCRNYVDIFDGGPTVECDLRNIESVRHSFRAKVTIAEHSSSQDYLISNTSFDNFRATAAKAAYDKESESVILSPVVAEALQVNEGEFVRMLAQ